jgi:diaminobutyrate-2-oxoglutarate transaminase
MEPFEACESQVRSYCRSFPTVFEKASGYRLYDEQGREFIDFFSGAGTVSYGHNNPYLKERLLDYLRHDGILHALDMATVAKRDFLLAFQRYILEPRQLEYKLQFPGPTGTNAVEAALKLARKVTRRSNVLYFHNAYHGMTLGALAVTGNASKRRGAGVPLQNAIPVPFDGGLGPNQDTIDYLEAILENPSSGVDLPAAAIVETVQAEGGINAASFPWLKRLEALLHRHGILLIVDDIQVGCGRTGPFFSFEPAGLRPDIVCLSKAISGFGLPMSLVLIRPELDVWLPGEHNGTFRGNNAAFVTGTEALARYWSDDTLSRQTLQKEGLVQERLREIAERHSEAGGELRGRGLIQGIRFGDPTVATRVSQAAFSRGLIIETAGPKDEVLKLLPPLVIDDEGLEKGLEILGDSVAEVFGAQPAGRSRAAA